MSDVFNAFCDMFQNKRLTNDLEYYLKYLSDFKVGLSLAIREYGNNMRNKKETWRNCNIGYLRNKLKEHYVKYNLDSNYASEIRIDELVDIINYSLMLIQRETDTLNLKRRKFVRERTNPNVTNEAALLIEEKKQLDKIVLNSERGKLSATK